MDKIEKFLLKLTLAERIILSDILRKILTRTLDGLDVKKLVWEKDLFRVRKWKMRIIFRDEWEKMTIINVDYRGNIYK